MTISVWCKWCEGWLPQANVNPAKIIIHSAYAPGGSK